MSDIHQYAWLGAMALVPTALLLLLGGMGWRKLAQALALLVTVPLAGAALVAVIALKLAHDFGRGGRHQCTQIRHSRSKAAPM